MKNKQHNLLAVYGLEAVLSLAKKDFTQINRLYFNKKTASLFGSVCKQLATNKIPYNCVQNDSELEKLSASTHHQGVVAFIKFPSLKKADQNTILQWSKDQNIVLCLDSVLNANNVGAIIRSASFFGIKNIVLINEKASISSSTYRVAQGGMEYINLFFVDELSTFLIELKKHFLCIGCDVHTTMNTQDFFSKPRKKPLFLIVGNEEKGISANVRNECDYLVKIDGFIPVSQKSTQIESLNVAQATSIFCYEATKKNNCL
ncbi:MAG: TrmH family RNA methyltransferase [Treponemataceae bacterium]